MRLLLFGKNGQIGWELQRALAPLGELVALGRQGEGGLRGDFSSPEELAATVRAVRPDVIVNAAAHTDVDKAERDEAPCRLVNATGPAILAEAAKAADAWLVHYSTDYVFDGSGSAARSEDAAPGPLNAYGRAKLAGEDAIRASGCRHLILRTSWVYGTRGANFARTMLRLAQERQALSVIDDQVGAPTGADLVADVTAHLVRAVQAAPSLGGTYHVVAEGETSWHGYASHVIAFARAAGMPVRVPAEAIAAVPTSGYPSVARRPMNSRLSTAKLRAAFGLTPPPWQTGVERMLRELT